jgi:hypothetical protein
MRVMGNRIKGMGGLPRGTVGLASRAFFSSGASLFLGLSLAIKVPGAGAQERPSTGLCPLPPIAWGPKQSLTWHQSQNKYGCEGETRTMPWITSQVRRGGNVQLYLARSNNTGVANLGHPG